MSRVQFLFRTTGRAARWCAFAFSWAVLVGCGPGTGGTGTGSTASSLEYFGATPADVCTSDSASALKCPPPPSSNAGAADGIALPTGTTNGSLGIFFSTYVDGLDINLFITESRAILRDRCKRLVFEGDWGVVPVKDARFFGSYTLGENTPPRPGSMTMVRGGQMGTSSLSVVIRDANGEVVLGPVLLGATLVVTNNPAACPR